MDRATRQFADAPGTRHATPLLFAVYGPSGSGKTFSSLRLATGIQRVSGGEIFGIDTESNRMLQYAETFKFRHVPFGQPFSPLDYLDAIEYCVSKGAKTIIIDSMSHEHEGPGGVLEEHDHEVERIMGAWKCTEEKANIPAWGKPKRKRQTLINRILQINCNFIFCFRAKDKVKIGGGKVTQLGFMPIAGEDFIYEMSATALLLPGARGTPTWNSNEVGEKLMIKLPDQFEDLFREVRQLDEDAGMKMAQWAAGTKPVTAQEVDSLIASYPAAPDKASFDKLETIRNGMWRQISTEQKAALKSASDTAKARVS